MPAVMRLGLAHQPHRHQAVERARVTAAPGSIVETGGRDGRCNKIRSEEHTSELQSRLHLVCRLLLEKKKPTNNKMYSTPKETPRKTLHTTSLAAYMPHPTRYAPSTATRTHVRELKMYSLLATPSQLS